MSNETDAFDRAWNCIRREVKDQSIELAKAKRDVARWRTRAILNAVLLLMLGVYAACQIGTP